MVFVETPHLPRDDISRVIIGGDYADMLRPALSKRGIEVIVCPANAAVDPRLKSHVDLSAVHLGGNRILLSRKVSAESFCKSLTALGAELSYTDEPTGAEYPSDAAVCAAAVGCHIFHYGAFSVFSGDTRLVSVRQGYAKCAACVVSEKAVVTSDPGLAKAMRGKGIDVLLISPGGVLLPGYAEGFLGGSAFKLSKHVLAFTGTLDELPDKEAIFRFLEKNHVEPVFLTDGPVFDIGSAIPLTEK